LDYPNVSHGSNGLCGLYKFDRFGRRLFCACRSALYFYMIGWSLSIRVALNLAHGLGASTLDEAAQVDVTEPDQLISGRMTDWLKARSEAYGM
jgi:hypothetical protein